MKLDIRSMEKRAYDRARYLANREETRARTARDYAARHPLYSTWRGMRGRCNNPHRHNFHNYGGRGITICSRWENFENFLADMGERPEGHTLDRIDPDGNYEPRNCRWADAKTQRANKRNR